MKPSVFSNRRLQILLQGIFIAIWLVNFIEAWPALPLYYLWGFWGLLCLWRNEHGKPRLKLCLLAAVLSGAAVGLNLSLFEPVTSRLSVSNITMSLLGGGFASYQILLWAVSSDRKAIFQDTGALMQVGFILLWLTFLYPTDSRYSVYIFCAVAAILCLCHNRGKVLPKKENRIIGIFAGLFALATVLSNWPIFSPLFTVKSLVLAIFCLVGGFWVGYHILLAMMLRLSVECDATARIHPGRVFWMTFVSIAIIDLAYMFSSTYPGLLTQDSYSTVNQIMGELAYNNTMPFWHTVTVQPFLKLGLSLFGTVEAGIATFHVGQICFMAMCFGCVMVTLYQIGVPKGAMLLVAFLYGCIPYNIVYSSTLWKDVPFAGAGLLFILGLFRLLKGIGKPWLNYGILLLGAFGFSLWRTNGWYAFLATVVVMAFLLGKQRRKLLLILVLVLVLCWVLINPVLDSLQVSETNLVEAFAVPMQQVARVVVEDRPLTAEETEILDSLFELDMVKELYEPQSVDPIKFQTFKYYNRHLVAEDPISYLKMYLQLGFKYPGDYLKAWVEETKGYWNAGYDYWLYDLGEYQAVTNPVDALFTSVFRFLNDTETLKLFSSAGLYVWGMIACCVVNSLKKREELLLSIPALVLVVGLWLGTPVFCEFRYAYPVILALPFVLCVTAYQKK